jgi:shikimate kinase
MVITLIGFRGVGKSSIGPLLAARLGWSCVDADAEIIACAGKSIADIFAADGEARFRQWEVEVLAALLKRDRLVLSAGGGAVLNEQTRRRMRDAGPVVWLRASLETIWSRIGTDLTTARQRPALTAEEPRREVELLLGARSPLYAECATIAVETDGRTPAEIVEEIVSRLPAAVSGSAS